MLKRLALLALLAVLIVTCSNTNTNAPAEKVDVATLASQADQYVDKNVSVTGTVVHVCRHGGKKMFIIGEDPEQRFKITAGPQVGSFDVALEGSTVNVQGVVQAEVVEVEVKPEHEHKAAEHVGHDQEAGHEGQEEVAGHDNDGDEKEPCEYEHVTYYSLACASIQEIKE